MAEGFYWNGPETPAPIITGSSLVSGDLTFTVDQPGDLFYSYEASSTPLTGPALGAIGVSLGQTEYIGLGTTTDALVNYPTTPGTYYLQYVLKNGSGVFSNVVVETFTVVTLVLTMVRSTDITAPGAFGTSFSKTLPVGVANGNTLLMIVANGTGATLTRPSGWSDVPFGVLPFPETTGKVYMWTKTAAGDSGATHSWSSSGNTLCCGAFYELILPAGKIEWAGLAGSSDPAAVTPSTGGSIPRIIIPISVLSRSDGDFTAAPSGYSNLTKGFSNSPGAATSTHRKMGTASAILTNTTYDPTSFTESAHTQQAGITIAAW